MSHRISVRSDHIAVLEARAKKVVRRTYSSAEVRARLGLTGKK
jgi:hypothetical protein